MMPSSHQIGPLPSVKGIHFCNFLPIFIIIARLEMTKKKSKLLALPLVSMGFGWAVEPKFQNAEKKIPQARSMGIFFLGHYGVY